MRPLKTDQKVFGLGLSKTGTTSLTKALNIVGVKSIHFPHDEQTFSELRRGDYRLSILSEYQGASDTPIAPFFAQLDRNWPGSKFILTVREKDSWLRSAKAHWNVVLKARCAEDPRFRSFCDFINAAVYGCTEFSSERFSYVYDQHLRSVADYFSERKDDLLVLDICGGSADLETLCDFLGVQLPADHSFPHEYRSDRTWSHLQATANLELEGVVPVGASMLLIDQLSVGEEFGAGRPRLFFPEFDGGFGGNPQDDESAVAELAKSIAREDAKFLVLPWPAFWWLEHYPRFIAHLDANYHCVLRGERVVVWCLDRDQPQYEAEDYEQRNRSASLKV